MNAPRWTLMGIALTLGAVMLPAQADGVLDRVKAGGKIVLAHRESSVPCSYVAPVSKKPMGYALDLCPKLTEAGGK